MHVVLISGGRFTELEPEVDGPREWQLDDARLINSLGVIVGDRHRTGDGLFRYYMLVPHP